MKALALAALAMATLTSPLTTGGAHAVPTGAACGFAAVTDPQIGGSFTGVVAGALTFSNYVKPTEFAALVCTIQTGPNDTHEETDAAILQGTRVAQTLVAAGTVTYEAGPAENVYMCSRVEVGYSTLYWDADAADWSTYPGVACSRAQKVAPETVPLGHETDPVLCPILSQAFPPDGDVAPGIGALWDCPPYGDGNGSAYPLGYELDPIICPLLAFLFPPEGDVARLRDCPPYGDSGLLRPEDQAHVAPPEVVKPI